MKKSSILIFKNGLKIYTRKPGRNVVSDTDIIDEVLVNDQYKLKKLGSPKIIVDIGAHIGIFSLAIAQMCPNSTIIAYEPFKENYQLLKKNITANGFSNIIFHQKALSAKKETVTIFINKFNTGGHSLFPNNSGKKIKVKSISLEDVFVENKLNTIDLLKIDCEGGEYDIILKASKETLQKVNEIIFELHKTERTIKYHSPKELISFLTSNGYKIKILKEIYYKNEGRFWIVHAKRPSPKK